VDKGRDPEHDGGVDCWGLVRLVWEQEFGLTVRSYTDEYKTIDEQKVVSEAIVAGLNGTTWNRVSEPQLGDGLVFNLQGNPWHVGMMVSRDRFLHTRQRLGSSTTESFAGGVWDHACQGIYRHRELV